MAANGVATCLHKCVTDVVANMSADVQTLGQALAYVAAGGALTTAGLAVAPAAALFAAFLGLHAVAHHRDEKQKQADTDQLAAYFDKLLAQGKSHSLQQTETYIGLQVEAEDLRTRLTFLREGVEITRVNATDTNLRVRELEKLLSASPIAGEAFERTLLARFGSLDAAVAALASRSPL